MAGGDYGLVDVAPRGCCAVAALCLALALAGCGGGSADDEVEFVQLPDSRLIKVQSVGLAAFGPIVPYTATASDAAAAFGESAAPAPDGAVCTRRWPELGLTIEFAARGGGDPCADDARIEEARVGGPEAERTRWKTAEGIRPGMGLAAARRIYPDARRRDGALVLVDLLAELRPEGTGPVSVLEVTTAGGRVDEMVFPIGAGSG